MKKLLVLLVVLLLLASTLQVAFAEPAPPNAPPTAGSCNMIASWWEPGAGPGNANGVQDGQYRGMYLVHNASHPSWYTNGAYHMNLITAAHCG